MAQDTKGGYCKDCQAKRVLTRPGTNHILHLLLSIFTAGLWLIIWLGVGIKMGGWSCGTCGSTKVK